MTTLDRLQRRPEYPAYREYGFQYTPHTFGPPDQWPSGLGPGYSVYASGHGRNLAGVGENSEMDEQPFDSENSEGIETYPNELDALAIAEDVMGNGVFDPNDTHGNIHPDAGVFQDHQSLPGYVARDQFYELSEVSDLTHPGGKVMYVPGGAVSLQQGQAHTMTENQLMWKLPPTFNPIPSPDIAQQSIVDAPTASKPVGQTPEPKKDYTPYYIAAGVGVTFGLVWVLSRKKKR